MRLLTLITCLSLALITTTNAQINTEPITIKKKFSGNEYYQGYNQLTNKQLRNVLSTNQLAERQFRTGKGLSIVSTLMAATGGFLVGWPIGTALSDGDPNWNLAKIGAGIFVAAIPVTIVANNKTKKGISTFNAGLKTSAISGRNELRFSLSGNGVGLAFGL